MKQPVYAPGTMIAGKYRIDKAIARGGCSIVYRGTHVDMQRAVALKIMTPDEGGDDEAWTQRFQREAKLASQLRHPNTITTYDHGHDHGLWYIIMEWIEGASLRNVVRDEGPIEPERCARLTLQMLKSLEEAHRAKILHRDMKPSNIMLTSDVDGEDQVKVLDFGLAKADPSQMGGELLKLTRDGDFVGTPRYASPEQLKGRPLTNASDIYGVGMVMWEMLTGQPAVPQVDYATCVQHHLGPRPWTLPPGQFPAELTMIVEKALSKDPEGRYASCQQMRKALKGWLEMVQGRESFDLFDQIDQLEATFEHELLADALSDALSVASDSFEEQDLAPTRKNPSSRTTLPGHRVSGEGEPLSAPSPLEGLSGLEKEEEGEGERTYAAPASSYAPPELEAHAAAAAARPATGRAAALARDVSHQASPRRHDASRWIGVLAVVLITAIGLIAWGQRSALSVGGSDEASEAPGAPLGQARRAGAPSARIDEAATRRVEALLGELGAQGWERIGEPTIVSIGPTQQTSVSFEKGLMSADAIFYVCATEACATDLEGQAKPPTQTYREQELVVWLTPRGDLGRDAARSLKAALKRTKR